MLSELVVCYLFVGGVGAGACFVAAVLGLLVPRSVLRSETAAHGATRVSFAPGSAVCRLFVGFFAAGVVLLVLGIVLLVADLGSPDRAFLLFASGAPTLVTLGAWSLAVCFVLAVAMLVLLCGTVSVRRAVICVLQAALAVVAIVVMLYTGLLLQGMGAVPLWTSPLVAVLFVLSSLSGGIACVLTAALLAGALQTLRRLCRALVAADAIVVAVELAAVVAFAVLTDMAAASVADAPDLTTLALARSWQELKTGDLASLFWCGFVALGLIAPLVVEAATLLMRRRPSAASIGLTAFCVLGGGLALRYCMVFAGMHPAL